MALTVKIHLPTQAAVALFIFLQSTVVCLCADHVCALTLSMPKATRALVTSTASCLTPWLRPPGCASIRLAAGFVTAEFVMVLSYIVLLPACRMAAPAGQLLLTEATLLAD